MKADVKTIRKIEHLIVVDNLKQYEVAERLGVNKCFVQRVCRQNNIVSSHTRGIKQEFSQETINKIIDLYKNDKLSAERVSKEVNITVHVVYRVLRENNVARRTRKKIPIFVKNVHRPKEKACKDEDDARENEKYTRGRKYVNAVKGQADELPEVGQCKFPMGNKLPYIFCRDKAINGKPYCEYHQKICSEHS